MPHVIVKLWPGKSEARKKKLADEIKDLSKKAGIKNANIYVNAQNLFTITSYKVGDPEIPGSVYGIPLQRIVMGGVSFDF